MQPPSDRSNLNQQKLQLDHHHHHHQWIMNELVNRSNKEYITSGRRRGLRFVVRGR